VLALAPTDREEAENTILQWMIYSLDFIMDISRCLGFGPPSNIPSSGRCCFWADDLRRQRRFRVVFLKSSTGILGLPLPLSTV